MARTRSVRCTQNAALAAATASVQETTKAPLESRMPCSRESARGLEVAVALGVNVGVRVAVARGPPRWQQPGCPQLGAAAARIVVQLLGARRQRLLAQALEAAAVQESLLDLAILQRVKADEGGDAARCHDGRQRLEQTIELVEFTIDRNAQRLKSLGGRVDAADAMRADGAHHGLAQLERAAQFVLFQGLFEATRDAARAALAAVQVDQVRQLVL